MPQTNTANLSLHGRYPRIFLVEDIKVIRRNLAEGFEDFNAHVVGFAVTENEATAWLTANSTAWDLVVVDLFLLKGNGFGVLRHCKERPARQRIVLLTNYATPEIRQRGVALGVNAVFDKSAELEAFLAYALNGVAYQPQPAMSGA